jgi:hypothetical protein
MAYQKRRVCYRCGGKGVGVTKDWKAVFEKYIPMEYFENRLCSYCSGKGYTDYDFRPHQYLGVWNDVDWENFFVAYEDFSARYKCSCGDEASFSEEGTVVCGCGRVYKLSVKVSVDETYLNDMKYWEEYNENEDSD